jgi:hypothetical protein
MTRVAGRGLAFLLGVTLVALLAGRLEACTLWGVANTNAAGGTVISKNRDWKPDHTQVLKRHRGGKGYAYFGLYAEGGTEPGIKAGVNEKGLTVVTASASSIPKSKTDSQPGKHGVISALLSGYASCDEVLAKRDSIFPNTRAMFIMLSDRVKIVTVEVGLEGKYALKTVASGPVVHTNHFLEESLAGFNAKIGSSSATRLARITKLMMAEPMPCTAESFARISRDQQDGPDSSLWRTGKAACTLASWIVETPARGAPKLRVVLANPGKQEETHAFILDPAFWSRPPL